MASPQLIFFKSLATNLFLYSLVLVHYKFHWLYFYKLYRFTKIYFYNWSVFQIRAELYAKYIINNHRIRLSWLEHLELPTPRSCVRLPDSWSVLYAISRVGVLLDIFRPLFYLSRNHDFLYLYSSVYVLIIVIIL